MQSFDDIRPYMDREVRTTLDRLIADESVFELLLTSQFAFWSKLPKFLLRPSIRWILKRKLSKVYDVRTFQLSIAPYIESVIKKHTENIVWKGLDKLEADQSYLFLSNHRDIVMDSALINYGLYKKGMETMRVAIGDNLLSKDYVTDLMRLNKSFIVKRSEESLRAKLQSYQQLSAFINRSLNEGHSVWIAHREGRAKDGDDRTDPAIVKMLYMNFKKQNISLSHIVENLKIVPVAISYEYDPCDLIKANELSILSKHGEYNKSETEDIESIIKGITGWKGHVSINFGEPLGSGFETADLVAEAVDKQIHELYHLHQINFIAYDLLREQYDVSLPEICWRNGFFNDDYEEKKREFNEKYNRIDVYKREWLLKSYANPVINKYTVVCDN